MHKKLQQMKQARQKTNQLKNKFLRINIKMKHPFLLVLALALSASLFAQKKELKAAEKLLKKENYQEALSQLEVVEPLLIDDNPKLKAKYYFLKAKSLYANGTAVENDALAGKTFVELVSFEKNSGLNKYSKKASPLLNEIVKRTTERGLKSYKSEDYKSASEQFELVYVLKPRDTMSLEYAALAAFYNTDYDKAIALYQNLLDMGYTGIQYKAINKVNGKTLYYSTKKEKDQQVSIGVAVDSEVEVTPSKTGDLVKNIAFSYIEKGDSQAALRAIDDAKKIFPNDYSLIIGEANIYFRLGDNAKFLEGLKQAIQIKPEDPLLHCNVGVLTLEQGYNKEAIAHFKEAIRLKPDYSDAYNNIGVAIKKKEIPIIEEMNRMISEGMNRTSDFDKYDRLLLKRKVVYKEALPYYENALKYNPTSSSLMKTLIGLYELLEMYDKQKDLKAKLDAL